MELEESSAAPASDADMAMVAALGAEVGKDPYFFLASKQPGQRLSRSEVSYVMTLLTALKRFAAPVAQPASSGPASPPEPPSLPRASEAQLQLLTRLGQAVTGDGAAYLRGLLASGGAATTAAASAEIKRLKSLQEVKGRPAPLLRPLATTPSGNATTTAPPGRYAVQLPGTDYFGLFQVNKPTSGRWGGYTFVATVPTIDGIAPEPVQGQQAVFVLNAIEENRRGSAGIYGRMTGHCGLCNKRLSDPASISLGIGPECMTKL